MKKQMKFIFIGLFIAILALSTLYAFSYYLSRPVPFEDINFENAIRSSLDKPDGDITISHVRGIRNLEAVDAGIRSIEGIEYMTNLRTLNLEDNFIKDVRPLKDLTTLNELNLRNNELISLEDVHFDELTDLINLKTLNLRHNVKRPDPDERSYQYRLEDISLLATFPSLESLDLRDNHVKDPTPLADLTELEVLDISQNPIENGDLSVLHSLANLVELNLRETGTKDISFLTELTNLTYLNLHSNSEIVAIEPISSLTDLETLIIPNVPIKDDFSLFSELHQLKRLNVRNTGITSVDALESLMENGALQDNIELGVEATLDISLNPIHLEAEGENQGFKPIREYWDNISNRTPEILLPAKTETIYLNEYMASNSDTISDYENNYHDWIELYNPTDQSVDLEAYYLSDDINNLTRYELPKVSIEANSTLIIFASGEDKIDQEGYIHTNFSIDKNGEPIILTAPDQTTVVDYLPPRKLPQDISYGRSNDGNDFYYFYDPTPGELNTSEGSEYLLQPPKASHVGGFYHSEFDLTFDVPESHTVYYTTDGSLPSLQSNRYREPITIADAVPTNINVLPKLTVIRAISYDENNNASEVTTNTYGVGRDVYNHFMFPVISISTDPDNLYDNQQGIYVNENYTLRGREWERPAFVEVFEPNGVKVLNQNLGIRIHGGFSREFEQKSLRLYARSSYDDEGVMNYAFFEGLTAQDEETPIDQFQRVILRNSGNDWGSTMFRDAFMQDLISDLGTQATQASRPSVVFLNGVYTGIHNIRERQDEYYLASHFNVDSDKVTILSGPGAWHDKGDPEGADDYHDMLNFVKDHDMSKPNHYERIEQWIDIDNFIDYYIAQIYFGNTDWPHNNIKMWRYNGENGNDSEFKDGRWRWLLYDTDFGFTRYDGISNHTHDTIGYVLEEDPSAESPEYTGNFLFRSLAQNETFEEAFLRRFQNLLNITFQPDRVNAKIDDFKHQYIDEMQRHLWYWDILNNDIKRWQREIEVLNGFADRRPMFIKQYLTTHFDVRNQFQVTVDYNNHQHGQVFIDGLPIVRDDRLLSDDQHWEGRYYEDLPVEISVEAKDGYQFVGWEFEDGTIESNTTLTLSEDIILMPVFEAGIPSFAENYTNNIERAKTLSISITYFFSFLLTLVIIWSIKYFTLETYHKKINKIVSLSVLLSALLLIPILLRVWDVGIQILVQQLSITFLLFSLCIGAYIGAILPHRTKNIKTFDA